MSDGKLLQLAAEIVSAFVSRNSVPAAELAGLVGSVHSALAEGENEEGPMPRPKPVVPVRRSIHPDYLICLEDGKRFRMLKRHLRDLGLTPEQYRLKWNLPVDYPMVAANYSDRRSELAKEHGLGQLPKLKSKRGRGRKKAS